MAAPAYQSFNEGKAIGTSVDVTRPSGTAEGDLLIGCLSSDGGGETHTSPESDSWNIIYKGVSEGSGKQTFSIWWKKAGPSEPGSYSFGCGSSEGLYAWVMRITGQDDTDPIHKKANATGDSGTVSCPAVTTEVADCLVIRAFGIDHIDVTVDGGWQSETNITVDYSDGAGGTAGGSARDTQASAGDVGAETNTLIATEEWVGVTVAIQPPSAGIVVTPNPASSVSVALIGAIILGSLTLTPTPASAVGAKVDPTVIKGSIILTPSSASAIAERNNPTIVLGSTSVTPTPASAITNRVNPTVILPSMTVTPTPASAIATKVDPTVVLGSITLIPSATSAIGSKLDPTVILGSTSVIPSPAGCIGERAGPTVILGSMSITPSPASAIGERSNPSVILGSISLMPTPAFAIGDRDNPTVVFGSISISPSPASSIGSKLDPTVILGSLSLAPNPASTVGDTVDPTVVISGGGETITPAPTSAVVAKLDPTVIVGGQNAVWGTTVDKVKRHLIHLFSSIK